MRGYLIGLILLTSCGEDDTNPFPANVEVTRAEHSDQGDTYIVYDVTGEEVDTVNLNVTFLDPSQEQEIVFAFGSGEGTFRREFGVGNHNETVFGYNAATHIRIDLVRVNTTGDVVECIKGCQRVYETTSESFDDF